MSDTAGSRRDGFVDQLLLEAELDDDGQLRPALLQLRALGAVTPEPSAHVAALLQRAAEAPTAVLGVAPSAAAPNEPAPEKPAPSEPAPIDELAARRRAKRRAALTALSVAVSLSAGGAVAVASDQGFRDSFAQIHRTVTGFVTGTAPAAPAGNQTEVPAAPAPSLPEVPAPMPTAPAAEGKQGQPGEAPPSDVPAVPGQAADAATPGNQADIPVVQDLPTAVPGDLSNGVGQQPQVPVPGPSDLPVPATLPAVPLR